MCGARTYNNNDLRKVNALDVSLVLKVAGMGILVAAAVQILGKSGRDEQATFVTVAGIIVVLIMLVGEVGSLFDTVKTVFGL